MKNSTIDETNLEELNEIKIVRKPRIETETKNNRNSRKKSNKKENRKNNKTIITNVFTALFSIGSVGIIIVLFLLYGPFSGFREWLVTTAMTTMTHQYFATWFYDDETIKYILDKNKIIESGESTDASAIKIGANSEKVTYENEFERAILERDKENNDYKIIEIEEKKFDGYLVAVYEPSRIKTVATQNLGVSGQYLTKMAKNNDALIAINGGGFDDPNFNSTGGSPLGITVCSGKYVTEKVYNGAGGIRDAVTFGPFLIVNGKASEVVGNGGWGTAPRTAIAQRKDGIVLFLVLNGRRGTKVGADMDDLIEILQKYGAYNAANLDGGTSSVLVVGDTIVNDPIDSTGAHKTRPISTGFIVTKDESDNSDHTVVADKLK